MVKDKCRQNLTTSMIHHNTFPPSYICFWSVALVSSFCTERQTDRHTHGQMPLKQYLLHTAQLVWCAGIIMKQETSCCGCTMLCCISRIIQCQKLESFGYISVAYTMGLVFVSLTQLALKATILCEMTQNNGHHAVKGCHFWYESEACMRLTISEQY